MNPFAVALASVRDRPGTNLLSVLLLALGVAAIAIMLHLADALEKRLDRDAAGIDLVVGAKGSPMQLILSSIFHADVPTGNITLEEARQVTNNRLVRQAIPLALGDSFRGYRIVGTTDAYVTLYQGRMREGRLWRAPFEAVLGADVARGLAMPLGARFTGSHGLAEGGAAHEAHPYTVVGILAPTGTVLDRLILTSVDSVVAAHAAHGNDEPAVNAHDHDPGTLAAPRRDISQEITALLVQYRSPLAAVRLPAQINRTTAMQAAVPAIETTRLLAIMGVGLDALKAFAVILLASALLGIFIALLTIMSQRAGDIALMRTMGASRGRVFAQVLLEGLLLALAGSLAGLALAHGALLAGGAFIEEARLLGLAGGRLLAGELWLLGAVLTSGALAALIPAVQAYRIDIIRTLAQAS